MAMTEIKRGLWRDERGHMHEQGDPAVAAPLVGGVPSPTQDSAEALSDFDMMAVVDGTCFQHEREEGEAHQQGKGEHCAPPAGQGELETDTTALQAQAHKAIQGGQFGRADQILAEVEKRQTQALERPMLDAAQTTALRGEIALAKSHYLEAASHFSAAAEILLPGQQEERWKYLKAAANAFYRQGSEFDDQDAFLTAIEHYRYLASVPPRSSSPREWAMAQMNLGVALQTLGERESGTARLQEAMAAYREALQENKRESVPLLWAMTKMSLGTALFRLGERESSAVRIGEAIAAYREALLEYRRECAPLDFARTQMNLGVALETLGKWENGTARLSEAVCVFREALQENTRMHAPALWAMTQTSLGNALFRLGEREGGVARLEEAATAYREALEEQTRARAPRQWAATQICLGNVLQTLGARESGSVHLAQAVSAYREALQELPRTRAPLEWAMAEMCLGNALQALGVRESETARLEEAISAYHEASQEFTKARMPLRWATAQMALATVYHALFDQDAQPNHLDDALAAIEGALCRAGWTPAGKTPRGKRQIAAAFLIPGGHQDIVSVHARTGEKAHPCLCFVKIGKLARSRALIFLNTSSEFCCKQGTPDEKWGSLGTRRGCMPRELRSYPAMPLPTFSVGSGAFGTGAEFP
jgi:tetratricopeptide (TPR) repeat protein